MWITIFVLIILLMVVGGFVVLVGFVPRRWNTLYRGIYMMLSGSVMALIAGIIFNYK